MNFDIGLSPALNVPIFLPTTVGAYRTLWPALLWC